MNEEQSDKSPQHPDDPPAQGETQRVPPVVDSFQRVKEQVEVRVQGNVEKECTDEKAEPTNGDSPQDNNGVLSPVNILERLLAPQSLQWLMAVGGGMMVLGLIILLWINDFFTPAITAYALAAANLAVLGLGFCLLRFTKQHLVGQALTLLACLVMPLNLWYYSANNLITIDGHLWMPAMTMCAIYAAAAVLLKDKLFVYIFSAGITMTGLLIIADMPPSPGRFWEIQLPSTFLIIAGLISIHVERAFTASSGAFSRKEFGLAFFRTGHLQLAAGLLLILGAQIAGDWFYEIGFKAIYLRLDAVPSPMCGELRWLALTLVCLATYGYAYSEWVVHRSGFYLHIAALSVIWAELLTVQLLNVQLSPTAVIVVLAITSLAINLAQHYVGDQSRKLRGAPAIGLMLGCLPVSVGFWDYFRHANWSMPFEFLAPELGFVGAMLLAAVALRIGAQVYIRQSFVLRMLYFAASASALLIAFSSLLSILGLTTWLAQSPILLLLPAGYLIASWFYDEGPSAAPTQWVAHTSAAILVGGCLLSAIATLVQSSFEGNSLWWAAVCVEAALFYIFAAWRQPACLLPSLVTGSMSIVLLLRAYDVGTEGYIAVAAVLGVLLMMVQRLLEIGQTEEEVATLNHRSSFYDIVLHSGNALTSIAMLSGLMFGFFRLVAYAEGSVQALRWTMPVMALALASVAGLSSLLSRRKEARAWYSLLGAGQGVIFGLSLHQIVTLGPWEKVELFAVLTGFLLTTIGHAGWYREQLQGKRSDLVGNCLAFGAILLSAPLAVATWIHRYQDQFVWHDELGFLFVSILLLASGLMLQLRATTIIGVLMSGIYICTFAILVPWGRVNTLATAILSGGAVLFGLGVLLAFYREQILALPEAIQRRQGVFRVLDWR